jgi:hypothetical protein
MIHYFSNREISQKLEINLARWKRWSRSFLPPDPLGGMRSGYARQYLFRDVIKVYLGGHLISHLKMSVPQSATVVNDLLPWLKKNGYLDVNGWGGKGEHDGCQIKEEFVFFCPLPSADPKRGAVFRYLIRQRVDRRSDASSPHRYVTETYRESFINCAASDGTLMLGDPEVHMVNPGALVRRAVERLCV